METDTRLSLVSAALVALDGSLPRTRGPERLNPATDRNIDRASLLTVALGERGFVLIEKREWDRATKIERAARAVAEHPGPASLRALDEAVGP